MALGRSIASSVLVVPVAFIAYLYILGSGIQPSQQTWQHRPTTLLREDGILSRVSEFLKFRTVCELGTSGNVGRNEAEFRSAKAFILDSYQSLLSRGDVTVTEVSTYSLVLSWKGSKPELKPVMLYGHYDVVPVSDDSLKFWKHGPFEGATQDGYIWGRGAVDMKSSLIAILESWLQLHEAGFQPERSLLLGVGHDEEVGGRLGAAVMAATLKKEGVELDLLLDEGSPIFVDGMPPLMHGPVAMVSTAEKGNAAFRIEVNTPGGHSSMPPLDGAHTARVMADIIREIDTVPPPLHMQAPMTDCLQAVAPFVGPLLRSVLARADQWPVSWILARVWAAAGNGPAAQLRNTAVVTVLGAGVAQNVIPQHGTITVDMRLLRGQGGDLPLAYLRERVRATGWERFATVSRVAGLFGGADGVSPSEVAPSEGKWWDLLTQAIQESFPAPDTVPATAALPVIPTLITGGTDSKHLGVLSANGVFRFLPLSLNRTGGDLGMVHGNNERVSTEGVLQAVKYYMRLTQLISESPA